MKPRNGLDSIDFPRIAFAFSSAVVCFDWKLKTLVLVTSLSGGVLRGAEVLLTVAKACGKAAHLATYLGSCQRGL